LKQASDFEMRVSFFALLSEKLWIMNGPKLEKKCSWHFKQVLQKLGHVEEMERDTIYTKHLLAFLFS
jgi:hypothetical protein